MPSMFMHVVANGRVSFSFKAERYSTVYMYHIFIHLRHLGSFRTLDVVNSPAMNMGVQIYELVILFPLDIYLEVGFLDHMVVLFLIF